MYFVKYNIFVVIIIYVYLQKIMKRLIIEEDIYIYMLVYKFSLILFLTHILSLEIKKN